MTLETWTVIDHDGLRWCNDVTGEERRELRAVTYPLGTRLDVCGISVSACWSYQDVEDTGTVGGKTYQTQAWLHHVPSGDEETLALPASDPRLGVGATATIVLA